MRHYEITDLKKKIRVALDQNNSSEPLEQLLDVDTLTLEEIIESKIETAARMVEQSAPLYLLDTGNDFANADEDSNAGEAMGWMERPGHGPGYIKLPDDFLRLVSFQMSDWDYAVTVPITEEDPLYAQQRSRYGVRGNPQRPVVALVQWPVGLVLEFYTCSAGDQSYIKRAVYIPIPKIEKGKIKLSEKLVEAVVYQAAALVALTTNNDALAQKMQEICNGIKQ